MSDESPKVEFFANNGIIEIRYFDGSTASFDKLRTSPERSRGTLAINPERSRRIDTLKDELYCSWRLPESIAHELIAWWISLKKNKEITFPLQKRTKVCEIAMNTKKYIEIKSLDCRGRTNMTGWSLPAVVIKKLVVWQKNTADK
ncbi:MAG: hypothetical protein Q8N62_03070 [Candidatus Omnitrophota bacterium]|nr:hypothetical protein [Candidatus Omnitrophota bacterium]